MLRRSRTDALPAEGDVQSAAAAESALSIASDRVRNEWRARIAAEYTSAAITQQLTLWLMQAAAPPDLIDAGLAIVADELAHSRLSHQVYTAAGGTEPPALEREALGIRRATRTLEHDILHAVVRVFCLGETVAVPLFSHLRGKCSVASARTALDRILKDEVRHRDFGWDTLDYLISIDDQVPQRVANELPAMVAELEAGYGIGNPAVADDDGAITAEDRAWGLAPPREYAEILSECIENDYIPRFEVRGVSPSCFKRFDQSDI
jgi:hypothetical protein